MDVTCSTCGHGATLSDPAPIDTPEGPQVPEVRWQCDCKRGNPGEEGCECEALNVIEGHAGEPGEGALNPSTAFVSDEALAEAASRRLGMVHSMDLGGSSAPEGEAKV